MFRPNPRRGRLSLLRLDRVISLVKKCFPRTRGDGSGKSSSSVSTLRFSLYAREWLTRDYGHSIPCTHRDGSLVPLGQLFWGILIAMGETSGFLVFSHSFL